MDRVKITLLQGKGLLPQREAAVCDPFCVVKLGTQKYISTTKRGVNPVWNEGFLFSKPNGPAILRIETMNKDRIKVMSAQNIGTSEIDITDLLEQDTATLELPTKYGKLVVKVDNPSKAQSLGNTRMSQLSRTSTQSQQSQRPTSSTQPAQTQPSSSSSSSMGRGSPYGRPGAMGRGGPMGSGRFGAASEDEQGMHPPPMFPMGPPPGGWRRPPIFHPGQSSERPSHFSGKLDRWGQQVDSEGASSARPGRGSGRGGMMGRPPHGFGPHHIPGFFGGRFNPHDQFHHAHHQQLMQMDPSFGHIDEEDTFVPPTDLPDRFEMTDEEKQEALKRWGRFATFLAKPFEYSSPYKTQLQQLDAMGAINFERIHRRQIPPLTINNCAVLFFAPYTNTSYALNEGPVNNALRMAQLYKDKGYRLFYFCDPTPMDVYRWFDWTVENVESEIVFYFSGHVVPSLGQNKAGEKCVDDRLICFDAKEKPLPPNMPMRPRPPEEIPGVTMQYLQESALYNLIINKEYVDTRITIITDSPIDSSKFATDSVPRGTPSLTVPPNTIVVKTNAASRASSSSSIEVFTATLESLLSRNASATFKDLQSALTKNMTPSQNLTMITSEEALVSGAIIPTIDSDKQEVQVEALTEEVLGEKPEEITSIPEEDVPSAVEQEIAQVRWQAFCDELAKPAPYTSKYKSYLQKLDGMGAINLERITREQIPPNIYIAHCIVLFFNPYEDLAHTLDTGPINDALLMTELYLSRGYHVMYICDATPHEYYRWMDWLLDNVKDDLVVFFSGHGTQIKDTTGKEADGLSEVMVFYDQSRKKLSQATGKAEKITPISGITNETVSDSCMFDLITSKEYKDTRIVTITDCCHSGTMFNFDQGAPSKGNGLTPPFDVVCIGSAQDSETAKQTTFQGVEAGVFTYNFTKLLKDKKNTTFKELQTYMAKTIKKYQNISLNTSQPELLNKPIIVDNPDE